MNNNGAMAIAAVPMSIARMFCIGITASSRAPRGGAIMVAKALRLWFKPATLESCSSGTINEVDACIAAQ